MNQNWMIGRTAKDKVTGFSGIVTGVVHYLTGCHQALVVPKVKEAHEMPTGQWIDVQRLECNREEPALEIDNGDATGPDAAPTRRN